MKQVYDSTLNGKFKTLELDKTLITIAKLEHLQTYSS